MEPHSEYLIVFSSEANGHRFGYLMYSQNKYVIDLCVHGSSQVSSLSRIVLLFIYRKTTMGLLDDLPIQYDDMPPGSVILLTLITQIIMFLCGDKPKGGAKLLKNMCTVVWFYSIFAFRKHPLIELPFPVPWLLQKPLALPTGQVGKIGYMGFMLSLKITLATVLGKD